MKELIIGTKKYINNILDTYKFDITKNEYHKPLVYNNSYYFNKSHTKDLSALIIDNTYCGIDLEYIRKYKDGLARKICSNNEYNYLSNSNNKDYDFTLLWVLKESYLKCIGIGITCPLKDINFIENNKIIKKKGDFIFNTFDYTNHIIAICRKN